MSELRPGSWLLDEEADEKSVAALFKTKKKPVTDILIWVQCFASYVAVLAQSFPAHTPQFMAYLATIVRCHHRFEGLSWVFYDTAYRHQAAKQKPASIASLPPSYQAQPSYPTTAKVCDLFNSQRRSPLHLWQKLQV